MGYHVEGEVDGVVIRGAQVPGAIAVLKELMATVQEKGGGGSSTPGKESVLSFSWVNTTECLGALERNNLVAALDAWRYSAEEGAEMTPLEQLGLGHQHRDVVLNYFEGEKWGDDEQLWETLAPFVDEGGIITFCGEDNHRWRYVFEKGGLTNQTCTLVWEYNDLGVQRLV